MNRLTPINAHPRGIAAFLSMDGDLYDEFGNYIGPEIESDESEAEEYVRGGEEV